MVKTLHPAWCPAFSTGSSPDHKPQCFLLCPLPPKHHHVLTLVIVIICSSVAGDHTSTKGIKTFKTFSIGMINQSQLVIITHPSTKGIKTAVDSGKTKLTARHHHVGNWGPTVILVMMMMMMMMMMMTRTMMMTMNVMSTCGSYTSPFAKILLSTSPPQTKIWIV